MRTRIKVARKAQEGETLAQKIARAARDSGIGLSEDQVLKIASAVVQQRS